MAKAPNAPPGSDCRPRRAEKGCRRGAAASAVRRAPAPSRPLRVEPARRAPIPTAACSTSAWRRAQLEEQRPYVIIVHHTSPRETPRAA